MSSTERVARHRERMRAKGFKLVQMWVPDVNAPGFAEEAQRQMRSVAKTDAHDDVDEWMESVAAPWDDDAVDDDKDAS